MKSFVSAIALLAFATVAQAQVTNYTVTPSGTDTLGAPTQDSAGAIHFTDTPGGGGGGGLAAGDYHISDANGQINLPNACPALVYSFSQTWTFTAVTGGMTISNDTYAGNGFASKLFEQSDHTVCAGSSNPSGDVFTVAAVSGGYTIKDNTDGHYLADTGSAVTVNGFTGKSITFQTAPYTWTIQ